MTVARVHAADTDKIMLAVVVQRLLQKDERLLYARAGEDAPADKPDRN